MAFVIIAVCYDFSHFHNLSSPESMDAAQLARNVASGNGYTTRFIRPFSIYLLRRGPARTSSSVPSSAVVLTNGSQATRFPDVSNPPAYPLLLAGAMKLLPFHYEIPIVKTDKSSSGYEGFERYQPDVLITLINQSLFFCAAVLIFLLACRLFNASVGWAVGIALIGMEVFWKFSVSGTSVIFLLLIVTGILCLAVVLGQTLESKAFAIPWLGMTRIQKTKLICLAAALGLLTGIGCLTHYSFALVIVPVVVFLALAKRTSRVPLCLSASLAFIFTILPWLARNCWLTGVPFGTETFALLDGTSTFPDHLLERSLSPDLYLVHPAAIASRVVSNLNKVIQHDLANFVGSLTVGAFLITLLISFKDRLVRRIQFFIFSLLVTLVISQSLGRTSMIDEASGVSSENLIVTLFPFTLMYAAGLVFSTLNPLVARHPWLITSAFAACFWVSMFSPWNAPLAYPPYYPPAIQQTAGFMKNDELMMSDIPAAVVWYGNRTCVWLTADVRPGIFDTFDSRSPVRGVYFTSQSMGNHSLSDWFREPTNSWSGLIGGIVLINRVPPDFPLREAPTGYLPEQLFLTDTKRW